MTDEIPDELVARAVLARGDARDHGGVGHAMRAALRAVYDDLKRLAEGTKR